MLQEVMVAIRAKFEKLKEEVDIDLGVFAGDLVGTLEKISGSHCEWKEGLEDLLVVARQCATMSASEFWIKCETIVQKLDDKRQEIPVGILKQAHTHLLFILSRCTRLVQFQKETGSEQEHVLAQHQLSDLGAYPALIAKAAENCSIPPSALEIAEQLKKSHGKEQEEFITKQSQADQDASVVIDNVEVNTAKSTESTPGSYKMSSWRRFPSAAEKNRVGQELVKDENAEHLETSSCHHEHSQTSSRTRKFSWGYWGDQQNLPYDYSNSNMICRICEVEIPIISVEEHSRICTIADKCDLKGLTVNERLERVSETIERLLESWTPKSTPKSTDTHGESFEVARVSTSSLHEEFNELSLERNNLSNRCSEGMLDPAHEPDNSFVADDLNLSPEISCDTHICVKPDHSANVSSPGSLTPRSPLVTPRTSQIEILLSGRRPISELESYDQVYTSFRLFFIINHYMQKYR
jgi:hypothetical protein